MVNKLTKAPSGNEITDKINEVIEEKQDNLVAGNNITINNTTISATNTTYTNGTGLNLSNTTFSVDFNEVATASQGGKADTALQPNDNITQLVNNAGFITGITSGDVTTALGYTPYDSSNPSGYTSNVGTVTSVNNVSPVNGNVSITIPTVPTIATTVNASSTNAETVGAKLFYDTVGNIESALNTINSGS